MIVSAIAAFSKNRVIGVGNDLPWHLPADMKYFMRTTKGHHVVMGRKTYESMGKPLPSRSNIVITRDPFWTAQGVAVVHTIEEALKLADNAGEEELFIIGGGEIYSLSFPYLDKLYLTEIELVVPDGDTYFPTFNESNWEVESIKHFEPDEKNKYIYTFKVYKRRDIV